MHLSNLVGYQDVTTIERSLQSRNAHALQFLEIYPVLRDADGSRMTCRGKQRNVPFKRHDTDSFSRAARPQVLCIEAGSAHSHGADDLTNKRGFSDAWLSGYKVCCLHA